MSDAAPPRTDGDALLAATLVHLRALVAFDTRNPPRVIDGGGIFAYLREHLPGFTCTLTDLGDGAVTLHAVRGTPRLLWNVHLDTVPDSPAWSADPHVLRVTETRAVGLGACDIKGAAAALLAVANATDGDLGLLFSSDEEGANPRCIASFLDAPGRDPDASRRYEGVVVAEPTRGAAVLAHRGILSVRMEFAGRAGHASGAQGPADSALHQAVRWGNAALDYVAAQESRTFAGLTGLRFNIGVVEGGIKANMIAPAATLRFGCRPLPDMDGEALLETFRGLARTAPAACAATFRGAALPAGDATRAEARHREAGALATRLGILIGPAVDFWTEAALFSAAGHCAFVYGPGDIAQAHSADEWVALDALRHYAGSVQRIVQSGQA